MVGDLGDQPFSCDAEFGDIGIGKTKIKPLDFRFWIHDVALVRANGQVVPLSLKQDQPTSTIRHDGAWQKDNVARLDMENATGFCTVARDAHPVIGTAARHDDYTGLQFKVGVPRMHNNVNSPLADYPFGAPGMAWQWKGVVATASSASTFRP